jgi:hypothetical protein
MSEAAKELLEKITDQVDHAVELVKAARMAAESGGDEETLSEFGRPIAVLLDVIANELRAVRDGTVDDLKKVLANV